MENNFLKTGYVMVSRALLTRMFEKHGAADSSEEAFLRLLVHANYRDAEFRTSNKKVRCLRGESVMSFAKWADILGWSRGHTSRFFQNCFKEGSVERVEDGCRSHIRIPNYDLWMGDAQNSGKAKRASNSAFGHFMDVYSEVTHTPRINVGRAQRVWSKLTMHERELALSNIEQYYNNLPDVHYCMQSATYLADKAFLDNYNY